MMYTLSSLFFFSLPHNCDEIRGLRPIEDCVIRGQRTHKNVSGYVTLYALLIERHSIPTMSIF